MFNIDWSDPQTFWLNVTNVVLLLTTVICLAVVVYGVGREVLARLRQRMPILARETSPHVSSFPELGLTMADGGEPVSENKPRRGRISPLR